MGVSQGLPMQDDRSQMYVSRLVARRVNGTLYIESEVEAQRKRDQGLMGMLKQTLTRVDQSIPQSEERRKTMEELLGRSTAEMSEIM